MPVEVGVQGQVNNCVPSDYLLSRNVTRHVCVFLLNSETPPYIKESKVRKKDKPQPLGAANEGAGARGKAGMTPSPRCSGGFLV